MADDFGMGYALGQDSGNGGNAGGFFGNEGLWAVIILAIIFGWGRNGFGGESGGGNVLPYIMSAGGLGGADTRAAVSEGFALNGLENGVRGIQQGLCDGFYGMNTTMLTGFNGIQSQLCSMSAQNQACCCETQRLVERGFADTNYNLATQSCETRRAIQDVGRDILDNNNANTRAILDFLTQDKISALQAENQTLKFAASQQAQNAYIAANQEAQTAELIRRLGRDCPIPAYVVPNPNCCYGNPVGVSYGGNSCGCCA